MPMNVYDFTFLFGRTMEVSANYDHIYLQTMFEEDGGSTRTASCYICLKAECWR